MSADDYTDCPKCEGIECVRIDGINEYNLEKDGTITNTELRGKCKRCGMGYGKYKGENLEEKKWAD